MVRTGNGVPTGPTWSATPTMSLPATKRAVWCPGSTPSHPKGVANDPTTNSPFGSQQTCSDATNQQQQPTGDSAETPPHHQQPDPPDDSAETPAPPNNDSAETPRVNQAPQSALVREDRLARDIAQEVIRCPYACCGVHRLHGEPLHLGCDARQADRRAAIRSYLRSRGRSPRPGGREADRTCPTRERADPPTPTR